ncbi:MAG: SDR family NAD(P)-dependent oxidoreductase, partial [Candidatus Aminicenantes bacterium]
GDPVEIEGLKLAFNTKKKGFCGIGSIKTNVGHLDAAAGVTGFIKTVLALKHQLIPPSINFQSPNPQIDFIDSPFYVNAALTEWEPGEYPRRAGVSSFGIGGTNAHVILEQAPEGTRRLAPLFNTDTLKKYQLILLSAKSSTALDRIKENLAKYLEENPNINLADTAYTLQVGRKAFNHRWMTVCSSVDEAIEALTSPGPGETSRISPEEETTVAEKVEPFADRHSLRKIGQLWLQGKKIDWKAFYSREKPYRIPLPTYPFEKQHYWIDPHQPGMGRKRPMGNSPLITEANIGHWFYLPTWKRSLLDPNPGNNRNPGADHKQCWLIFDNEFNWGDLLVKRLLEKQQQVIIVKRGEAFTRPGQDDPVNGPEIFTLNPGERSSYHELFRQLSTKDRLPGRIIHLWNVTGRKEKPLNRQSFDEAQWLGFYSLLYLAQAIGEQDISHDIHLMLLTDHFHEVIGGERLCPEKVPALGLLKAIPQEYPGISCKSIDILLPAPGSSEETGLVEALLEEFTFSGDSHEPVVAFRNNQRWVEIFEPLPLLHQEEFAGAAETTGKLLQLREQGVYLVTGGLGKIGFMFSELLAKRVGARLVLIGRSAFPSREEWNQWLENHDASEPIALKIKRLQQIEEMGGKVLYLQADVANFEQMKKAITQAEETFGKINGVIHLAGIIEGQSLRTIRELSASDCQLQFQSKAYGLMVLWELFKNREPDFYWLLSSISCVLAGLGFGAYASANLFMDVFARRQNQAMTSQSCCPHWFSLDWDGMEDKESIIAFERIFSLKKTKVHQLVFSVGGDLQGRIDRWIKLESVRGKDDPGSHVEESSSLYPRPDLSTPYEAPRSPVETAVADIWKGILGYDEIGIRDDFLELGGDSLKSITVISKIHQELNVNVPLTEFFSTPTIEAIAQYVSVHEKEDIHASIEPAEEKEFYPVSSAQKRLYTLQQMDPDSESYNMSYVFTLEEESDKDRLEEAFRKLIYRHESLRTTFRVLCDEPVQYVCPEVEFEIEYYDLATENTENTEGTRGLAPLSKEPAAPLPRSQLVKSTIKTFIRPFDLAQAPLLRVGLIKPPHTPAAIPGHPSPAAPTTHQRENSGNRYILMVDMHHIVSDGISLDIFVKDFVQLYTYPQKKLAALRLQYKDFSEWQNLEKKRGAIKKQEEYWLQEFSGEIPILNIACDYTRPVVQSFEGRTIAFALTREEKKALNEIARSNRATLFMVLLAVYYTFLSKISGQEDIVVGTPVVGRRHTDLNQIMGIFVNTLALRNYPYRKETFAAFLNTVKEKSLQAFENQDYQFEDLVEKVTPTRDMSRNPLFDVVFDLNYTLESSTEISQEKTKSGGLKIKPYSYEHTTAKFDLTLMVFDRRERLDFVFEYCTRLFKEETILKFTTYFKKLVSAVVENPGEKISEIEIITAEEKNRLLYDFNNTKIGYPRDKVIPELFEKQAEKTPDHVALVGTRLAPLSVLISITYKELNRRSNQLAWRLKERGAQPDTIVGIMVERSVEMIIGILGILKSGGAYLPIDPDYPRARIDYMLKDSNVRVLVTTPKLQVKVKAEVEDRFIKIIDISNHPSFSTLTLTSTSTCQVSPTNLAYVIYTSGTTGNPKG